MEERTTQENQAALLRADVQMVELKSLQAAYISMRLGWVALAHASARATVSGLDCPDMMDKVACVQIDLLDSIHILGANMLGGSLRPDDRIAVKDILDWYHVEQPLIAR